MPTLIQILFGTLALSFIHASIPSHWLPLVTIGKTVGWSRAETLWITAITGFVHITSTLLIGIAVGLLGYQLGDNYKIVTHLIAPIVLIGLGLGYLSHPLRQRFLSSSAQHDHDHVSVEAIAGSSDHSKWGIVMTLSAAMFVSPCLEIGAFYLSAGGGGWLGIVLVSTVYSLVTVLGMLMIVNWSWHKTEPFLAAFDDWNLDSHVLTGAILIALGCFTFFINI
ncbi:hypothetical protein H6G45_00505 [Synechocystis sp. FACHB-383]|jgi:hypothetical protein|uniref:hypothetical protein n=1 Tax=unclassified Synechocystis TaxID=2640012 RepID=UPI00168954A8|nr:MULTISPECIES: hypothetical protein [unclassified Synechocystis]MBD2651993.1 hypothetical protein [Synechocystis sp. FACHB-383]MBE9193981.1 hypothetical protein [Synechocystis sp. LEGE 06083]